MASASCRISTFKTRRTGADDHDLFFLLGRFGIGKLFLPFVRTYRIDVTGHGRISEQPCQAKIAGDAVPHFFFFALRHLLGHVRIGNHRTADFPNIELAGTNFLIRQPRLKQAVSHLNGDIHMLFGPFGQMNPVAHGNVTADNRINGFLPSQCAADVICTGFFGNFVGLHGFFRCIAAHIIQQLF